MISVISSETGRDSELDRVSSVVARLELWLRQPAVPIPIVEELTGLSRTRICQLIEGGSFDVRAVNGSRRVVVESVVSYFSCRASKLSRAGKRRCK